MRGGTQPPIPLLMLQSGLSPLARGHQQKCIDFSGGVGSIPACAGAPAYPPDATAVARVYPRLRGGTLLDEWSVDTGGGLSPLARGHRSARRLPCVARGSIPACAGAPTRSAPARRISRVYPRLRGGTWPPAAGSASTTGLSPLARGHRAAVRVGVDRKGSIPACAGAPPQRAGMGQGKKVYPRLRGGTVQRSSTVRRSGGLSPLARGHLSTSSSVTRPPGSIPACAGAPSAPEPSETPPGVYPRLRGGTRQQQGGPSCAPGLSPLARGHLEVTNGDTLRIRSIPACAGAPASRSVNRPPRWRR